jgi:transcriptional regulator with XRE-family HTH domain
MATERADRWHELGAFIREQRGTARLSLRRLSELAGVSNPYLSQIERGLRRPSAEILQQIARALRISAETLYVQAGILEPPDGSPDLARMILADPHLGEEQKQALVRIYLSFRRENEATAADAPDADADASDDGASDDGASPDGASADGASDGGGSNGGASDGGDGAGPRRRAEPTGPRSRSADESGGSPEGRQ